MLCSKCGVNDAGNNYKMCEQCRKDNARLQNRKTTTKKLMAIDYKGGVCSRCRQKYEIPDQYDFHHVDENKKETALSELWTKASWNRIKEELDRCIMVCANCHRAIHYYQRMGLREIKEDLRHRREGIDRPIKNQYKYSLTWWQTEKETLRALLDSGSRIDKIKEALPRHSEESIYRRITKLGFEVEDLKAIPKEIKSKKTKTQESLEGIKNAILKGRRDYTKYKDIAQQCLVSKSKLHEALTQLRSSMNMEERLQAHIETKEDGWLMLNDPKYK